jgi:hypothetical protein
VRRRDFFQRPSNPLEIIPECDAIRKFYLRFALHNAKSITIANRLRAA